MWVFISFFIDYIPIKLFLGSVISYKINVGKFF